MRYAMLSCNAPSDMFGGPLVGRRVLLRNVGGVRSGALAVPRLALPCTLHLGFGLRVAPPFAHIAGPSMRCGFCTSLVRCNEPSKPPTRSLRERLSSMWQTIKYLFRFYINGVQQIWRNRAKVRAIKEDARKASRKYTWEEAAMMYVPSDPSLTQTHSFGRHGQVAAFLVHSCDCGRASTAYGHLYPLSIALDMYFAESKAKNPRQRGSKTYALY